MSRTVFNRRHGKASAGLVPGGGPRHSTSPRAAIWVGRSNASKIVRAPATAPPGATP